MKTILLDELTQPIFYLDGVRYTALSPMGTRILAKDDTGKEIQFSVYTKVQVEEKFTEKSTLDAFMHLNRFKEFALNRMKMLYNLLDTSDFYKNSQKSIELYEYYGEDYRLDGFKINFMYGFDDTGHFEGELITLDLITVSDEEWIKYCENRLAVKIAKEQGEKIQNELRENQKKMEQYLKLKAEFGD